MKDVVLTPDQVAQTHARLDFLRQAFLEAPPEWQPVYPQGTPHEVPYTDRQMITAQHLRRGSLPVDPQLDNEFFIRLGCRWSCTNCSVPEHVRHAPEVLMRPEFWDRVFEITEDTVVRRFNAGFKPGGEPNYAPYVRIIGGEPSTYHPTGRNSENRAVSYGNVVDVMRAARNRPFLMAGLFSDGASLAQQPDIMEQLVEVEERHHTSVDYLPQDALPNLHSPDVSDREVRASYGGHVAAYFAKHGVDTVANIVLIPPDPERGERGNIDQILDISRWLWERGVTTTYVPIIWREHRAQHGRKEQAYATELQTTHTPLLKEIIAQLVKEQLASKGMIRNSRGYLEGIPFAGVDQLIGWEKVPGTISISPNGRMGIDPVFKTLDEALHSPGGYYGYEDHQGKWQDFRAVDYTSMLERELRKWEVIVASENPVSTRVDPVALIDTIHNAIDFWEQHPELLLPTNDGQGMWWDNTIKNTKVGKYKGIFRKDLPYA